MAAMAAILDLVSVGYLTSACDDWSNLFVAHWGHQSSPYSTFPYALSSIYPQTTFTRGHMPRFA
jgi:hypothetical protein